MAKPITSSGIRIPVELDVTRARKEASKLGQDFASILKQINAQFKDVGTDAGSLIDMKSFTRAITTIQTAALKAKDAVDSIGKISGVSNVINATEQSAESFRKLSQIIGVTERDLQSYYRQALNKQAVTDQVAAMKGLESAVGGSRESVLSFARAVGISQEALAKYKLQSKLFDLTDFDVATEKIKKFDASARMSQTTIGSLAASVQKLNSDTKRISEASEIFKAANGNVVLFTRALKEAGYSSKEIGIALRANMENASSSIRKAKEEIDRLNPTLKSNTTAYLETVQAVSKFVAENKRLEYTRGVAKLVNNDIEMLKRLASQFKLTEKDINNFIAAQNRANEQSRRGISGVFTPSSLSAGIQSGIAAAGVSLGMYGLVDLGKSAINTSMQMEAVTTAFESIYGSADRAAEQLKFIRKVSDDLGLSFLDTAREAKKLFASAESAGLSEKANDIFLAFSNAGAALKLTSNEMSSIYLAVSQIMSKGKVSAEEINQQLSERLPGATTLLAKAMNVTSVELFKMFEQGQVTLDHFVKFADALNAKYSGAAKNASHTAQAELGRVSTAWQDFKDSIVDTGAVAGVLADVAGYITGITDKINSLSPEAVENWKSVLGIAGKAAVGGLVLGGAALATGGAAIPAIAAGAATMGAVATAEELLERSKETSKVIEEQNALLRTRKKLEDSIIEATITGNEKVKKSYVEQLNEVEARLKSLPDKYKESSNEIIEQVDSLLGAGKLEFKINWMGENAGFTGSKQGFEHEIELFRKYTEEYRNTGDMDKYTEHLELVQASLNQTGGASEQLQEKIKSLVDFMKMYSGFTVRMQVQVDVTPMDKVGAEVNKFLANTAKAVAGTDAAKIKALNKDIKDLDESVQKADEYIQNVRKSNTTLSSVSIDKSQEKAVIDLEQRKVEFAQAKKKKQEELNELLEAGNKKAQKAALALNTLEQENIALSGRKIDLETALGTTAEGVAKKRQNAELAYNSAVRKIEKEKEIALTNITKEEEKQLIINNAVLKTSIAELEYKNKLNTINQKNASSLQKSGEKQANVVKKLQAQLEESEAKLSNIGETSLEGLNKSNRAIELANQKYKQQIASIKEAAQEERIRYAKNSEALKLVDKKEQVDLLVKEQEHAQKLVELEEARSNQARKDAKDRVQFYKELQKYSSQYSASLVDQNVIIEEQMARWRLVPGLRQAELNVLENILRLEAARDPQSGITRAGMKYVAESEDLGKEMEDVFSSLYKGLDTSTKNMWTNFLKTGKSSLSDLKNTMMNFIAEISYELLLKPIQVQLIGSLTTSGSGGIAQQVAQAAGGAVGGGGGGGSNILSLGSMIPDSWKTGITNTINESMASAFPSLFGTGFATNFVGSAGGLTTNTLSSAAINSVGGAGYGGMTMQAAGALPTFTGAISPGAAGGAIGSLVGGISSPYINDLFGIPNNKESQTGATVGGLGASAVMTGLGLANIWNPGGWAIMAISALSSIFGGAAGGMFGGKPKRPAVWGGAEIDLGNPTGMEGYDFTEAFDPKNYGKESFWTIDSSQYAIASRSRNKASGKLSETFSNILKEIAETGIAQANDLTEKLPEKYADNFKKALSENKVKAEWDFKGDDITEEAFKNASQELFDKMRDAIVKSFQETPIWDYEGKIDIDRSTIEGIEKFTQALQLTEEAIKATENIGKPLSDFEQEAEAAKVQIENWAKEMQKVGVTAEYAKQLTDEYRIASIDNFIKGIQESMNPLGEFEQSMKDTSQGITDRVEALKILNATEKQIAEVEGLRGVVIDRVMKEFEDSLSPLSQYEQAVNDANNAVDDRIAGLRQLGATEEQIAQIEGLRGSVLSAATSEMLKSYNQEMELRKIQLTGNDYQISAIKTLIDQENELANVREEFGEESRQFVDTQAIQLHELTKLHREAAESLANTIRSMNEALDVRYLTATGKTDEAAMAQLDTKHRQELEEARKQAIEITDRALLEAKAAALNKGQTATPGQELIDWTPETVLKAINDAGLTIQEWFEEFGKAEGFGDIGAGYKNTAYEDQLRFVQSLERLNLIASQAQSDASEAQAKLDKANSELAKYQSEYDSLISKIQGLIRQLKNVADDFKNAADALREARVKLWTGNDNLNPESRLNVAQSEFDETFKKAMAGDAEAAKELAGMGSTLLSLYRDNAESAQDYMDAFYEVEQKLKQAQIEQEKQYDLAKAQYEILAKQYELQETQALTQQQILEKLAEYQKEQAAINAQIAAASAAQKAAADAQRAAAEAAKKASDAAAEAAKKPAPTPTPPPSYTPPTSPSTPNPPKPTTPTGPYNGRTQDQVLAAKAAAMNQGRTLGPGQKAGGWTASKVMSEIVKQGYGFDEWYQKFGRAEGFAKGGITPINLTSWAGMRPPFITGENGPELVVSPQQYGVIDNKTSMGLLNNSDDFSTVCSALSALLTEVGMLRSDVGNILRQIAVTMSNVRSDTRAINDQIDEFMEEGLLVNVAGGN